MLRFPDGGHQFLRVRSLVGLIPLLAVGTLDADVLEALPDFRRKLEWFLAHRPDLGDDAASATHIGQHERRRFAVVNTERLQKILARLLDEKEFLSPYSSFQVSTTLIANGGSLWRTPQGQPESLSVARKCKPLYGIRSVSRYHADHPYRLTLAGQNFEVNYEPAESRTGMFGGNSNWRGPVWFPINYLLIEALQKYAYFYGADFKVECPTGSGHMLTLDEVAAELSHRLIRIFLRDEAGRRPVFGGIEKFQTDPNFRDHLPFHEYFDGDHGAGLGASHQTGWTGLVARLIQQSGT